VNLIVIGQDDHKIVNEISNKLIKISITKNA